MKIYMKFNRYGALSCASYQGQSIDSIIQQLTSLGATEIEQISEAEFLLMTQVQ